LVFAALLVAMALSWRPADQSDNETGRDLNRDFAIISKLEGQ
jgi:hypothetical protein